MARKPIKQRIEFEGSDKMQKDLAALGKVGEKAFADIQKAALKVDFTRLTGSLRRFGGELATFGKKVSLAFAGLGVVGGLSFAGTARALTDLAKSAGEVADQTGKAAEKAGLSTEAFSKLAFAAEQSDVSQEQLVTAFSRLNRQLSAAAAGNKTAVALFQQLGVAIKDAQGRLRPTEDIIHDISAAFARMPNGVKKSALALELFGRAGADLIPFLNAGKAGLLDLEKQAEQLGIALTDQQAAIGDALGDALDKVGKAASGIRLQLGLVFAPTLTRAADLLTQRIIANRKAIVAFGEALATRVGPVIDDVINALAGNDAAVQNSAILKFRDQTIQFGQSVQQAVTGIIIPAFNALRTVLGHVATALNTVFGSNISGDAVGIAIAIGSLTGAFRLLRAAIDVVIAGLILLTRHPVVAALTAIAAGLVIVANKMRLGETSAQAHQRALGELRQALDDVKNNVPGARDRLNELAKAHLASAKAALVDAQAQVDAVKQELELERAKDPIGESFDKAQQQRTEQTAQALVDANVSLARRMRELEEIEATIAGKSIDKIEDLRGKADGAAGSLKAAGDAGADGLKKVGDAAAATEAKVEALGSTIKVTSFGGGEKTERLFDIDTSGAARARDAVSDLTQAVGETDDQAAAAATALDGVDDQASAVGTAAGTAAPKVGALNTSLKDTSTSVINVAEALGRASTETTNLGTAADGVATKITAAKTATDDLFITASNNSAGLGEVLAQTADSAAGLGTALGDAATAAGNLGASFSDAEASASQVASAILSPFQTVASGIASIMDGAGGAVRAGFQSLQQAIAAAASSVSASIERILSQLRAAAAAAARLQQQARGGGSGTAPRPGFASGGHVRGAGTATSDSILAMLSDGEFVVRTAAVKKYGVGLLAAINSLRLPADLFAPLKGFNMGGLVHQLTTGMAVPKLANGGQVQRAPAGAGFTQPVNLVFQRENGEATTVVVMAQQSAVNDVVEAQRDWARNSTGRGQSWKGRR